MHNYMLNIGAKRGGLQYRPMGPNVVTSRARHELEIFANILPTLGLRYQGNVINEMEF